MATAEDTLVPTEAEIQAWKMPEPDVGEVIVWYPHAKKESTRPLLGWISRVNNRSTVLKLANGRDVDSVPHLDDPRLLVNANRREFGAWDYPPAYYRNAREIEALKLELQRLSDRLDDLAGPADTESSQASRNYHDLRRRAKEMGIQFTQNPSREWLEEQIAAKTAGQT